MLLQNILIIAPIILPLIFGLVQIVLWNKRNLQKKLNVISSAFFLAVGIALLYYVNKNGIIAVQMGNWPAPYGITLVADLFSAIMVVMTCLMGFTLSIFSISSIDRRREKFGYYPLLNVMYMGICGSFLTGDMFNLYVWFEVMLISSFVLLSLGGEKDQLEGSIKYLIINLLSSSLFLTALGILYGTAGTLNMADLAVILPAVENQGLVTVIATLFIVAFGIKSALFPLFFWLPASYHTPPAAISAIFAGMLTKVGVYVLIRIFTLMFTQNTGFTHTILLYIAGSTMFIGILGALAQLEIRKILSFQIISHIGYIIMGLAIFTPLAISGAVFYMVHHIIVITALFFISGLISKLKGTYVLKDLGGMYVTYPFAAVLFMLPALSLSGIPPLSGFWSKFLLIKAGMQSEFYFISGLGLLVGLLTLYSMMKIWNEVFWKKPVGDDSIIQEVKPLNVFLIANRYLIIPVALLTLLTVLIGFFPEFVFDFTGRAAEQLLNPAHYINAVNGDITK